MGYEVKSRLDSPGHLASPTALHVRVDIGALVRLAVCATRTEGIYLAWRLPHLRRMRAHDALMLSIDTVVRGPKRGLAFRLVHVANVVHLFDRS